MSFLISRFARGLLLCGGFVFAFSYSSAPYIAHYFKLTMFQVARKSDKYSNSESYAYRVYKDPRVYSVGTTGGPAGDLVTIYLRGRN